MQTRTALQLITDSLKLLGAIAGDEVPSAQEQADGLARLNELIDRWGLHAQTMLVQRRDVTALVAGQQSYLVGPGGDFPLLPRPMTITGAALLTTAAVPIEIPLVVLTDQEFRAQRIKTLSGVLPRAVYYQPSMAAGTLWVWPIPQLAQPLVLYTEERVAEFPDLTTPVALAPGYATALRTNLAAELAAEFGRPLDPLVDRAAHESLADVKRQNFPLVEIAVDPGLPGAGTRPYDVLTDA